ncbi:MAG: hypothetical protein R2854_00405 [Caldilineaceae bacterium]
MTDLDRSLAYMRRTSASKCWRATVTCDAGRRWTPLLDLEAAAARPCPAQRAFCRCWCRRGWNRRTLQHRGRAHRRRIGPP